jgi:ATP-binding cassette subfamily B protein
LFMKKLKANYGYTTLQNLRYAFSGAMKWQPLIVLCTVIFAVSDGLRGFVWIYGAKLIIQILESAQTGSGFRVITGIVFAAAVIELILRLGMEAGVTTASSRISDVRCKFILFTNKKVMTMPFALLEEPKVYNTKRKGDEGTSNMVEGMEGILRETARFLSAFIMMAAASVILWNQAPFMILAMLLLAVGRGLLHDRMSKWEKEKFHDPSVPDWRESYHYYRTASSFEYAKDIRIFRMKGPLHERYGEVLDRIHTRAKEMNNRWRNTLLQEGAVGLLQEGIMYAWLVYAVLKKGMSVADFTLYLGSIRSFNSAVAGCLERWNHIVRDSRLINDFRAFLDYPNKAGEEPFKSTFKKDYERFGEESYKRDEEIPYAEQYEFRFEDVSFAYPGSGKEYALKGLNLVLEPGKRLAVVGLNGAGKSTFIKLLCGLYEPTEGTIYMNGKDISRFDQAEYYKLIAPVFQNVECFALPICENISMSVPEDTDKDKALDCLEKAGLKEKIESLPQGLDTELLKFLHMDGTELSGGEKQKLAMARALYKDAPVVVLDEPTAALDALAEYRTYMDFDKLIGGKTAVYISHRLSSTRFCHKVAMFEKGCMIEYDTHEKLLEKDGEYARMFRIQSQYYQAEEVAYE